MSIYGPLEEALHIPWVIQAAILTALLLAVGAVVIRRQIAAAGGGIVPDKGVTLRNAVEVLVDSLSSIARDTMGEEWRRYFPLVGTIFVFILIGFGELPLFQRTVVQHVATSVSAPQMRRLSDGR